MSTSKSARDAQPKHLVTFFDDKFAKTKYEDVLSLEELADEISRLHDISKKRLPWLKLARFGEQYSKNNCLRTNRNLLEITGIEIDYDAGEVSFDAAASALQEADLRCILYTSASHTPDNPRWRVLAPTSRPLEPSRRVELVAAINGVLGGVIAPESFVLSTAYYYGYVGDGEHHRVEVFEGRYVDACDDLWQRRIYKQPRGETKPAITLPTSPGVAPGYDDEQIQLMLEECRKQLPDGSGQWHSIMLSVTSSLINKGWTDKQIFDITEPYCDAGWGDADIEALIRGARSKFGIPDPDSKPDMSELIGPAIAAAIAVIGAEPVFDPGWRSDAEGPQPRPANNAEMAEKVSWLVRHHAYCAPSDTVIDVYKASDDCQLKPLAFQRLYRSWHEENEGPKGGKKFTYAATVWELSPRRISLAGVRMRPDMPFPIFEEHGERFKNTYLRPVHDAPGGDVAVFTVFLERFLPDPAEREWLLDWMAHKQDKPWIPGTAVVFVADNDDGALGGRFGTGRGIMAGIAHKLYGERYARSQSFGMMDGTNSQSAFNDWLHGSVLVTVDEAKTSPTAYRRGERNAAYEVLKELVDPAPKRHRFNGKHKAAFDGMSYCSVWVATNHTDAMSIPEGDRRFSVLRNGRELTPEEAIEITAWRDDPANIAALSRLLAARDLSGFNMFQPLETAGKAEMAEMARGDVEEEMTSLSGDTHRGLAFTKKQLERLFEHNHNGQGGFWRGEFLAAWPKYCVGLKGAGGSPFRVRMGGTQKKVFCFRVNKKRVEAMPEAARRREVVKWGGVDPIEGLSEIAGLSNKM